MIELLIVTGLPLLYSMVGTFYAKYVYCKWRKKEIDAYAKNNSYPHIYYDYLKRIDRKYKTPVDEWNDKDCSTNSTVCLLGGLIWPASALVGLSLGTYDRLNLWFEGSEAGKSNWEKENELKQREENINKMEKELGIGASV